MSNNKDIDIMNKNVQKAQQGKNRIRQLLDDFSFL